jgi:hypothetical protein
VDADIVAHHFDNGVPWPEALAGAEFDAHVQDDWEYRRSNTPAGHQVYLAITPLSIQRDGLAPYRGERDDMPLPAPWDSYSFDHPDVKTAFLNYALRAIEYFEPDYLAIGIEVNLLMVKRPELWPSYVELHQFVYGELKARHPDLPIFVSLLGTALLEGYQHEPDHAQQMRALADTLPYTDYFGLSLYPYLTVYLAGELPSSMWDDLFSLSDKPIAITETGYPAEAFSLADGTIEIEGTPEKQAAYIEDLLQEAEERQIIFVINFVLRDYDALYELVPEADRDLARVWRDTGLYDGAGNPRLALEIWRAALARPYHPLP